MVLKYGPDPKKWGLDEAQAAKIAALSPEELEYAYRVRLFLYRLEDAKRHAADLYGENPSVLAGFDDGDYAYMAERFEDEYDCNVNENSQWESIVESTLKDKEDQLK